MRFWFKYTTIWRSSQLRPKRESDLYESSKSKKDFFSSLILVQKKKKRNVCLENRTTKNLMCTVLLWFCGNYTPSNQTFFFISLMYWKKKNYCRREIFAHIQDEETLIKVVCEDRDRPPIPDDMPETLVNLITRCWDPNPQLRVW